MIIRSEQLVGDLSVGDREILTSSEWDAMSRIDLTRTINAPVADVFRCVSDIREYSKVQPQIVNVQFLTDQQLGTGTRFRETRLMNGKEAMTELEVTEFVENDRVRMVADSHGTIWDTVFTVKSVGAATELNMVMDAKSYKLIAKLMNLLIKGMITKAVSKDLDQVKAYCESRDGAS